MDEKYYEDFRISEVKENLMARWKEGAESFQQIRQDCGCRVFDAVMAVLLGGADKTNSEQIAYLKMMWKYCGKRPDSSSWCGNAGLKANTAPSDPISTQRGFFDFPEVSNQRIQEDFSPDMKISEVCEVIQNYSDACFRKNVSNTRKEPRENFIRTLDKIVRYSIGEAVELEKNGRATPKRSSMEVPTNPVQKTASVRVPKEKVQIEPTWKEVHAFLTENERKVADYLDYAIDHSTELIIPATEQALKALRRRKSEAASHQDLEMLERMTAYIDYMMNYRSDMERYLAQKKSEDAIQ